MPWPACVWFWQSEADVRVCLYAITTPGPLYGDMPLGFGWRRLSVSLPHSASDVYLLSFCERNMLFQNNLSALFP